MNVELDFLTDTLLHIAEVRAGIEDFRAELSKRGALHDATKLQEPEFSAFVSTREDFKTANYGTPEYQSCVDRIKTAVDHHHVNNRHHAGFHTDGVNSMNLIDILEMLSDWKAAARRSPDRDFESTLEYAFNKYKIGDQLSLIIKNTLEYFSWVNFEQSAKED